jgi:hypothetical protein
MEPVSQKAIEALIVALPETAGSENRSRWPDHGLVGTTNGEIMTTRILALVAVACSFGGTAASATNLKPFDPVALRKTVEATAKGLLLPGTMVLLRTPQGEFVFGYGATELGVPIRILGLPRIPRR